MKWAPNPYVLAERLSGKLLAEGEAARADKLDVFRRRGRRHVYVPAVLFGQHALDVASICRHSVGGSEQLEALGMIIGQLRGEERVRGGFGIGAEPLE